MSTKDWPGGRSENRALMLIGHYAVYFLLAYAVIAVTTNVMGEPDYMTWPVTVFAVLWLGSFAVDFNYHESRLCERCIAATPLDPQAAVSRWKLLLRARHRRVFHVGVLGAILVCLVLRFTVASGAHWYGYVLDTIVLVPVIAMTVADLVHRRLYPWCPWCHWDDGGDKEPSPDIPDVPVAQG